MTLRSTLLLSAGLLIAATGYVQAQTATLPSTNKWQSTVTLGLTLTRGNSDTTTLAGSAGTVRTTDLDKIALGIDGIYGTAKQPGQSVETKNAETLHSFGQYNFNFTERLYGYARLDYLHDGIADIHYRITASPGAGYYFIKTKPTDLSLEVGPGYIYQNIGTRQESYATLRVAEKFHHAISDRARVWETVEWLPQVDYMKNYIINAEVGIEADLNKAKTWALRFTLDDTWNNVPAPMRKKNDVTLIASIAYKF